MSNTAGKIREMTRASGGHVHLAGVCGIGMAGLAVLLKARGFKVTGCDLSTPAIAGWLKRRGIGVLTGHDPRHVAGDVEWVIRTSAVAADSPEVSAAAAHGCAVFLRGEVLAALVGGAESVAIAGTHGKTTTTGLVAQVLKACGGDPSFCIGGEVPTLGGVAGIGAGALVVEADESDGTLALYRPACAVVTNIEPDHMEHFGGMPALRKCFRTFVKNARRKVIYCADDPEAGRLCGSLRNVISYGFAKSAGLRAIRVKTADEASAFDVFRDGKTLGKIFLPMPGRHNVQNALAAIAVALDAGIPFDRISAALAKAVLPKRRFEKIIDTGELLVVSDYGHHPSEIRAFVAAAKGIRRKRNIAVFQPHRYTRTLALGPDFPPAFAGLDEVVLAPVYAASEKVISGGTIWDLYALWRKLQLRPGRRALAPPPALLARSLDEAWAYLRHKLRVGDALFVVGAGDVEKIAWWAKREYKIADCGLRIAAQAQRRAMRGRCQMFKNSTDAITEFGLKDSIVRFDEPLSRRTTLRVGGTADIWIETGSLKDLLLICRHAGENGIPFRIMGAGSNALVSDLGVRGIVARLSGEEFRSVRQEGGVIVACAGLPLARLLAWMTDNGMTGLEFLEGVPGTVGGALRMNAGAWGDEIGRHVEWVRCLDSKGEVRLVSKPEFGYRSGVRSPAILEAGFGFEEAEPAHIRRRRACISRKRAWMKGLRCAGSIFRNPPDDFAGRLIEKAGLKGLRVGGAVISPKHANVISTGPGACASDVMALIEKARIAVRLRFGVELETEVEILA